MFAVGVRCLCHAAWVSPAQVVFPSGVVTFLFIDIEGSTRRWEAEPDEMRLALAADDEVLRAAI
jgi:class 3 adenylate cyclase